MYIFRHSQENWNKTSNVFSGKNHLFRGRQCHKSLLLDLSGPKVWGEASGAHPQCPGGFTSKHMMEQRWTKCLLDPLCAHWRCAFIYMSPSPCLSNMFLIIPCGGDLRTTPHTCQCFPSLTGSTVFLTPLPQQLRLLLFLMPCLWRTDYTSFLAISFTWG